MDIVVKIIIRKKPLNNIQYNYGNAFIKGKLSDSFTNYNYVGNTKVSVSIKNT